MAIAQIMFAPFLPYWRNESSGKLALAVERYFAFVVGDDPNPLTDSEIALLKGYLKFWLYYPWQGLGSKLDDLQAQFEEVETYEQLTDCLNTARTLNIDPF